MTSLPKTFAAGGPSFLCLVDLFILLFLCSCGAQGGSLREHRLRGSDSDSQRGSVRGAPNADMLKALEYIESLRQRTGTDSQQRPPLDVGRVDEEDEGEEGGEDKSEELLQAVLTTLQQTEKASRPVPPRPALEGPPPRAQQQQSIRPHRKLPLMFEDEEEDEDGGRPYKRTTENVEEKYTPQNLATLQSVFDELDKLTGAKTSHNKRQDEEEEDEEEDADDEGEDDDVFNDGEGEDPSDWGPLQEQEEEEEEEEEDNKRGFDYVDDDDEGADEEEEDEDESYLIKRSNDQDDMANLVDYYLLKVLEKTEEEEHKREMEEEEEERERRAAQTSYRENIDPQAIYQLIHISQKYQIPPENLLEMLKTGEVRNPEKPRKTSKLPRNRPPPEISSKSTRRNQEFHNRRLPGRQKTPEEARTEAILSILGLGEEQAPVRKQQQKSFFASRFRPPPPRHPGGAGESAQQQRRLPGTLKDDYDDTVDEDELAAYLAAQMLTRYPGNKASQKREEAGRGPGSSFDAAIQDYFDRMDSGEKRRADDEEEEEEEDGETKNDAMMKLLKYLNPETEESNTDAKSPQGI
ncbi:secretogranin-2a [Antennarius striatus]|uniref:secretogranin-2a n=1 Tax=Antennarius striatus TaxID=241820 RepID=UPI0035AEE45D